MRWVASVAKTSILVAEVSTQQDWPFTNDNSPRTGREAVTVAMFCKEFQEWSESCVLRSIGLLDLTVKA